MRGWNLCGKAVSSAVRRTQKTRHPGNSKAATILPSPSVPVQVLTTGDCCPSAAQGSGLVAGLGESWRHLETIGVLGTLAVLGLIVAPILLRRMGPARVDREAVKPRKQQNASVRTRTLTQPAATGHVSRTNSPGLNHERKPPIYLKMAHCIVFSSAAGAVDGSSLQPTTQLATAPCWMDAASGVAAASVVASPSRGLATVDRRHARPRGGATSPGEGAEAQEARDRPTSDGPVGRC
jgi:hypothetical protein